MNTPPNDPDLMTLGLLLPADDTAPINQETMPAGFYNNLLLQLGEDRVRELSEPIIHKVREDMQAHEPYVTLYATTIRNLGLTRSRKTADMPDPGAPVIADPSLLKAASDIAARIMGQFWATDRPVKTKIMGNSNPMKMQKAERIRAYMSFQICEQIHGYYEQDDLLFNHLPFIGTAFKKLYFDGKQIVSEYVSPVDLIVPYEAESLIRAERITHVLMMSKYEFKKMVRTQFFVDLSLQPSFIEQTQVDRENNNLLGKTAPPDPDSYEICECHCLLEIEELYPGEGELPYILSYDKISGRILRLSRNWEPLDVTKERCETFTVYRLKPWKGVYGLGLTHEVGTLNDIASDMLSDFSKTVFKQNMVTGLKIHNDRQATSGSQIRLQDGMFSDIHLPPGAKSIQDAIMVMPTSELSPAALEVYKTIVDQIGSVATVNSQQIADATNMGPVGTTYALIAEGAKSFNAIFKRQHMAKMNEFRILYALNRKHLNDQTTVKVFGGELIISKADFDGDIAVIPVSDPTCSTVAERVGRLQVIGDMAIKFPGIMNGQAIIKMAMETIGIPELEGLITPAPPPPQARDPIGNIEAIMKGLAVDAFPAQIQDCDQHIAVYTHFLQDPSFGGNKYLVQTGFTYKLIQLIMSFQVLRTQNMFNTAITAEQPNTPQIGQPGPTQQPLIGLTAPPLDPQTEHNLLVKMADPQILAQIMLSNKMVYEQIQPEIEESLKHMPPQPVDPELIWALSQRDKMKAESETQASRLAIEAAKIQAEERQSENNQNQSNLRQLMSVIGGLPPGFELFGHLPANVPDELKNLAMAIDQIRKQATPPPEPMPPSINQVAPPDSPPGPPPMGGSVPSGPGQQPPLGPPLQGSFGR